jgi:hypothetical protein
MIKRKDDAKILVIDIEWAPALAYVWRFWDENIQPDQLIDHGGMLCFCAHWHGSKDFMFFSKWEHGRVGMAKAALSLLEEADAVVHFNGDKYDMPKITGEIVLASIEDPKAGLKPPPKVASIDLLKAVKKFGFNMNRLAYIGPLLKVGGKTKHQGFLLWKDVLAGDEKAQRKMTKYCIQDVRMTARLYDRVGPYITNHPVLRTGADACPHCASKKTQKRGFRYTRSFRIQRNQCTKCSHWFETTRTKVK